MFYLILVITSISLLIYSLVSFYPSNRSAYDRREQNVELFKAEKKNLELNTNLSQESINILVNEREQILLQDVPKEKELVVLTQRKAVLKPLFISVVTFLAISLIYFQPLSLGSLVDLQAHQSIYGFISSDLKTRDTERESVIQELNSLLNKTETTASEIYFLSNRFRDINEFLISSLLLRSLIGKFSDEIPKGIFAEYAQILFFKEKNIFSKEVDTALQIALEKSPIDPIALTLKGVKYFQAGETDLALSSWEKAKENTKDESEKTSLQEAINTIKSMKNQ